MEKDIEKWTSQGIEFATDYGLRILGAILIWIVGSWIIKKIIKGFEQVMSKREYEVGLKNFLTSIVNWSLKILLVLAILSKLGVETTSFAAVIAAAGLAIGMALQGSLANFAGGVLILIIKPFKVGDWISAQGVDGAVTDISIFNTKLTTFGNQLAIIPNGKLSNDNIINYTELGIRREALTFGIGYDDNIKTAKDILLSLINEQPTVIQDEDKIPMVMVAELGDSSVNLQIRYWAKNEDFWNLRWLMLEEGKARLEAAGITIPFPQRDVHLFQETQAAD